jgi:RNA polymerase sigma-70 factor (ECF subfamily)
MPQRNVESIFAISLKDEHSDHINADLKQALLTLSPEDRALIFSRVIDEKSYMELEELYRVPAVTLRKRYERAKKKLSKALQEINPYYEKLEGIK